MGMYLLLLIRLLTECVFIKQFNKTRKQTQQEKVSVVRLPFPEKTSVQDDILSLLQCVPPASILRRGQLREGCSRTGFWPRLQASRDRGMISLGTASALAGQRLHWEGQPGTTCLGSKGGGAGGGWVGVSLCPEKLFSLKIQTRYRKVWLN